MGLAACWPPGQQPVVVECDPAGGDLLARLRLETSPGLVSLAAAARHGAEPGLVWGHTQRLPGGLPVVVGPAGADQARAALAQLTVGSGGVLRRAADRPGTVVIADCGRASADTATVDVIRAADITLLLTRVRDDALSHLATALATAPGWLRRACFVLVGEGYPTAEVAHALGIEVMGRIPEDPVGAAVLEGAPSRRSAAARSPLLRALEQIAASAAARAKHSDWGTGSPPGVAPDSTTAPRAARSAAPW
jgi:MinD-like ATPase involved in chromosome partitioning or flagellar assembly